MNVSQAAAEAARLSTNGEGYATESYGYGKDAKGEVREYGYFNIIMDGKVYSSMVSYDECFDKLVIGENDPA